MKLLIVEDEQPAYINLKKALEESGEDIDILAHCTTVEETITWLKNNGEPDLAIMDIELPDGESFNIFNNIEISCPVIFITGHNKYLTDALDHNGIDYILKPLDPDKLLIALKKYKKLQKHFSNNIHALMAYISAGTNIKSRITIRKGLEYQSKKLEDIAYFFTEHKLIFVVDNENKKYLAEKNNLSELQDSLSPKMFYRANRQYIININFIKRFRTIEKSKISIELTLPLDEEIIVSQENASDFKKWIEQV
ncbi:MAG: response regulator transcription factor [Chitinophagaceae bacterium]|nr:response regulator transcription factor [Chitinophagaceae bacterium]